MTRKSKREIERALERLHDDGPTEFEVTSEVVTVTEDDVDENGNYTGESTPEDALDEVDVRSGAVGVYVVDRGDEEGGICH